VKNFYYIGAKKSKPCFTLNRAGSDMLGVMLEKQMLACKKNEKKRKKYLTSVKSLDTLSSVEVKKEK